MMKLVIDISKEEYNRIQSMDWNNSERLLDEVDRVIHHGVPIEKVLEDIKAEVERHCSITVVSNNEPAMTLHDIFGILNKHISGKENK